MQSAHKKSGRPTKTKQYDTILDFKVKVAKSKETKTKSVVFTNYVYEGAGSSQPRQRQVFQQRSQTTSQTGAASENQQPATASANQQPAAESANQQPATVSATQQPAAASANTMSNQTWDFQVYTPRTDPILEKEKEEQDFDIFSWVLPGFSQTVPIDEESEPLETDDDGNSTGPEVNDVRTVISELLSKFDNDELECIDKVMALKGKHSVEKGSAPEINLESVFHQQDALFTMLVLRMVLNTADWKSLKELPSVPCKSIAERLRKKVGSCLMLGSQIYNSASKFHQTATKKVTTLYLSTQGLTKKGIQNLCRLGLTTTVDICKLFSPDVVRNWYLKGFSKRIEDLTAGNFVLGFDNNYFHDATPQFAGDGAFVEQIDESHDVFSRFMMKTTTIFVSFPPKSTNQVFDRSADFSNNLISLTDNQNCALLNFMADVVEEGRKENGSLFFFKSQNSQNSEQKNYDPEGDGFCYLTLASKMGGDDSVSNMDEIIAGAEKELRGLFNVDVSDKDFLYMCDGKGFRLRAGMERLGNLEQKTTIGDLHVEINLHEALMDLFYDNFISKYAPVLGFTKSFKNPQATDTKKIRMILAALLMFSLLSVVAYSATKFEQYSKSIFPHVWFWAQGVTLDAKHTFLNQTAISPTQSSQVDETLLQDSVTCAILLEKIKSRQLQKHGAQRKAELIAILWKDDAAKKGESLTFPSEQNWLKQQSTLYLQAMCAVDGVSFGKSDQNRQKMINYLHTKSLKADQFHFSILDLGTFVMFIKFAILPYAYHCAVRTANWDLRIAVLKRSIELFQRVGKTQYVDLVNKHLLDLKEGFSNHNYHLLRQVWASPAKTTKTNISLDELCEFINKKIKQAVPVPTVKRVRWVSSKMNLLESIQSQYSEFLNGSKELKKNKSKDYECRLKLLNLSSIDRASLVLKPHVLFNFD